MYIIKILRLNIFFNNDNVHFHDEPRDVKLKMVVS